MRKVGILLVGALALGIVGLLLWRGTLTQSPSLPSGPETPSSTEETRPPSQDTGEGSPKRQEEPPSGAARPTEGTSASGSATRTPAADEKEPPRFSRPEDRVPDLSQTPTPDLVKRLAASKDLGELRKTAQTIGDRAIAGTLRLSENDQAVVRSVVTGCLKQAQSSSAQERVEAKHQIERLWHAAVPTLLDHFDDENMATAELAVKSLILMRDERIISALVDKAKAATSDRSRQMALFALKKMTEQRKSDIPGRKCLDDETSQKLYQELVSPALAEPIQ